MSAGRWNLMAILGIVAAAGAGVYYGWLELRAQADATTAAERHIVELDNRIATREQLLAEVRLLERTSPIARLLLPGDTTALAGAGLQGTVAGIIEHYGGIVKQAQVLPVKEATPFVEVVVRVDLVIDMQGLRSLLHDVEQHEPSMLISSLSLAPERAVRDASIGDMVQVALEIAGFSPSRPQ